MIVVDASALLAALSRRDEHHAAAEAMLLAAADSPLLAHTITLAEVLVGAAKVGKERELHADLSALGVMLAPRDDEEPLRLARLRASTGLKLPDCCVLDVAQRSSASVATFDEALARAARRLGVDVLP